MLRTTREEAILLGGFSFQSLVAVKIGSSLLLVKEESVKFHAGLEGLGDRSAEDRGCAGENQSADSSGDACDAEQKGSQDH